MDTTKKNTIAALLYAGNTEAANAIARGEPLTHPNGLPKFRLTAAAHDVTAASLSRIFRHFSTESLDTGIAILTSDRGDRALYVDDRGRNVVDIKQNEALNGKLRQKLGALLTQLGHRGWIRTIGTYPEDAPSEDVWEKRGTNLQLRKQGDIVNERSYIVPSVTLDDAKKLAKALGKNASLNSKNVAEKVKRQGQLENDFRQDAIVWASNKAGAFLLFADGNVVKIGDRFSPNNAGEIFTQWRKRRFSFASTTLVKLEYEPTGPSDWRQWQRELHAQVLRSARTATTGS